MKTNEDDSHLVKSAPDMVQDRARTLQEQSNNLEFSVVNNSEHAPEVCNEFVTIYYMENSKTMGINKAKFVILCSENTDRVTWPKGEKDHSVSLEVARLSGKTRRHLR